MADKTDGYVKSVENPPSIRTKSQLDKSLMQACMNRDVTAARKAILQGANINHRSSQNLTPILVAAEHGDVDLIVLLCSQENHSVNLEERTIYGCTALHLSVLFGHREATKELLNRGASTHCVNNVGRYPLHFATTQRDVTTARMLIKFGAPINVYDAFSESPLYNSVIRKPSVAMAKLLLRNGASSDPPPHSQNLGLLLEAVLSARVHSDFEAIKALIWYGGNVNTADPIGWRTPLHLVAINGRLDLAEYLIRHGADLYAKNRAGETPLEVAFNYRHHQVAYLIEESRKMQASSHTSEILESTEGTHHNAS